MVMRFGLRHDRFERHGDSIPEFLQGLGRTHREPNPEEGRGLDANGLRLIAVSRDENMQRKEHASRPV